MRRLFLTSLIVLSTSIFTFPADSGPLLLQSPTLSKAQIAFGLAHTLGPLALSEI